jgi:integrase
MGFKTKQDAERALEALVPAIRDGTAPRLADRQLTVGEFLDRWLRAGVRATGKPWRPSTRTNYERDVRLYLRPGLGRYRLVDLHSDDIADLWAEMRAGGRSVHTVYYAFGTLNSALNQAVLAGRITRNPCVAARVEPPVRPDPPAWEPEHVTAFLAHAREAEPDLAPAFQLAAWRGLRRGEIIGLRWADVDLDDGTLRVVRNATEAGGPCTTDCAPDCPGGKPHIGEPKTKRGKRTVSIGPSLAAVLRTLRRAQAERRLAAESWEDHDLVFPGPDGRWLPPHRLTQGFKKLVRELPDLPQLWLHAGTRHSAATHMLLAGVQPKVVQDQLGHATLAMTMDTYGHVIKRQRDASADAVEALYSTDVPPL